MVWERLPERELPVGIATVDGRGRKIQIGTKTAAAWGLHEYKTVTPNIDRRAHLLGLQFHNDRKGIRKVTSKNHGAMIVISCSAYLRELKAVPNGEYPLRLDKKGFVIVDMLKPIRRHK